MNSHSRSKPLILPADTSVFDIPSQLCKILNRDLRLAGIEKRDDRGRTLDVHALRHTFGTLMSKGGVAPRTAQAAMRHSKLDLAMNVYTDPALLDVRGALETLPTLALGNAKNECQITVATGTGGISPQPQLAPPLAPTIDKPGAKLAIVVKIGQEKRGIPNEGEIDVSSDGDKTKQPLTNAVSGCLRVEPTGRELSKLLAHLTTTFATTYGITKTLARLKRFDETDNDPTNRWAI